MLIELRSRCTMGSWVLVCVCAGVYVRVRACV